MARQPDLVLLTGDNTHNGTEIEWQEVIDRLFSLHAYTEKDVVSHGAPVVGRPLARPRVRHDLEVHIRQGGIGLLLSCAMATASCSSSEFGVEPGDAAPSSSAPEEVVAGATTSTSTSAPAAATSLSPIPALVSVDDLPRLQTQEAPNAWGELEAIGGLAALDIPLAVQGAQSVLFVEPRGQIKEGCEGGAQSLGRLMLHNHATGSSTMLIAELEVTDSRFVLGPNGQLAVVGGCDANAWLAAVGNLDTSGALMFRRLSVEPELRIAGSGNAGVSVTWSTNGEVLFFDSIRVNAATGERLDTAGASAALRVHAALDNGTRLVSTVSGELRDPFWMIDAGVPLDVVPERPPDFIAQATFPVVQVRMGAGGERAYAVFEDWEAATVRTVVMGDNGLLLIDGRVEPSPSGVRLLVSSGDQSSGGAWSMVDLATGTSSTVPLPAGQGDSWFTVAWGATDDELLISAEEIGSEPGSQINLWLQPVS